MPDDSRTTINRFFEAENDKLLKILRHYVIKTGLAPVQDAETTAAEVLNETVVEALHHPERFQAAREPIAWVLGVALNLIKRRLANRTRLNYREPLLRDLYTDDSLTDDDLIDHLSSLNHSHDDSGVKEAMTMVFAHLSDEDAHLLRLAVIHELNGDTLARDLGITPGAARVRLHRALKRLRQFWGSRKRIVDYE